MKKAPRIKVLVVDDHPVVREGLGAIVDYQDDFKLVGEAANATEAISLFDRHSPDVTLVDLSLPDIGGIELIRILKARSSAARFLVLTANAGGSEIGKALEAGAHAYLFKDSTSEEVMGAIRTVFQGGRYLSPAVGRKVDEVATQPQLTDRELEVLRWVVHGHSNLQIATQIFVAEDTIKFHIKNIFLKLGVSSRSKAAAIGIKLGLVVPEKL
jgi:DNA-binding NarL/FixJ family response regulator